MRLLQITSEKNTVIQEFLIQKQNLEIQVSELRIRTQFEGQEELGQLIKDKEKEIEQLYEIINRKEQEISLSQEYCHQLLQEKRTFVDLIESKERAIDIIQQENVLLKQQLFQLQQGDSLIQEGFQLENLNEKIEQLRKVIDDQAEEIRVYQQFYSQGTNEDLLAENRLLQLRVEQMEEELKIQRTQNQAMRLYNEVEEVLEKTPKSTTKNRKTITFGVDKFSQENK